MPTITCGSSRSIFANWMTECSRLAHAVVLALGAEVASDEIAEIAAHALRKSYRFTADGLGAKLRLTDKERSDLQITTTGAIDRLKPQRDIDRAQKKRRRDKRNAEGKRRRKGALPRALPRPRAWRRPSRGSQKASAGGPGSGTGSGRRSSRPRAGGTLPSSGKRRDASVPNRKFAELILGFGGGVVHAEALD